MKDVVSYRLEVESMIPTIADFGLRGNGLAETRALRNAIYFNNLNSKRDVIRLASVLLRIVEIQNISLMDMAYNKLKYLGFEGINIPFHPDMGQKQLNQFLAGNYMNYYETRTGEILEDLQMKLEKLKG